MCLPPFTSRARAGLSGHTRCTGMDKDGTITIGSDLLEIDDELIRVVLGKGHDLGAEKGENVVGDDRHGFIGKVRVVDAERAKPT